MHGIYELIGANTMIIHPSLIKNEIDNIQKMIKDLENSKKTASESEKANIDKEIESLKKNLLSMSIRA